jgi:pyrroloquinoline quinone biosynthesis protein D
MTGRKEVVPKLARGVRISRLSDGSVVLLVPEGVVKLAGSAPAIVELVDGVRSIEQIVNALAGRYDAAPATIEEGVVEILEGLSNKALVDLAGV